MKTCTRCAKTYPDSEKFCETDGTLLVPVGTAGAPAAKPGNPGAEALECPVCGGKAEPGEAICNFCGTRLDPGAAGQASEGDLPARKSPVTQRTFDDEPPSEDAGSGRRVFGAIAYTFAALVALAAGAWLALRLSAKHGGEGLVAQATPSAIASPVPSGPLVVLADKMGLQVTGESASAPERDQAAARKVFGDNAPALLDTYKRALATDATLHDGMVVRLRVTPDGAVTAGEVRVSTAPNPALDQEAVKTTMGWRFAPFGGTAVEVDYPIVFARDEAERGEIESALNDKLAHLPPTETPEFASAPASPLATPAEAAGAPVPSPAVALVEPPRPKPKRPPQPAKPTLLKLVQQRLNTDRRFSRVKAYTNGGTVTLFGKVFNDDDKFAAERTVRRIDGVSQVINTLTTDAAEWADRQERIQRELQNAGLAKVSVKVIGPDAYLSGEVSTDSEKQRAVTIAEQAAPVSVRTNLIRVVPGGMLGF